MARNICVKLPGSLPALAGGGAGAGGTMGVGSGRFSGVTAGKAGGVCPEAAIFSIGTGVKTLASSSLGRTAGALAGSGVLSACSMRVNSPGPAGVGAGAVGIATGSAPKEVGGAGTGACDAGENGTGWAPSDVGGAGAGETGGVGGGGGAAAAGSGAFLPSAASRSSSSREGVLGTVPKIPVALEADPPPGGSDWGEFCLPKRSLNALTGSTICVKKLRCSGIQDYIALA
jgi:hypothetical protein